MPNGRDYGPFFGIHFLGWLAISIVAALVVFNVIDLNNADDAQDLVFGLIAAGGLVELLSS